MIIIMKLFVFHLDLVSIFSGLKEINGIKLQIVMMMTREI